MARKIRGAGVIYDLSRRPLWDLHFWSIICGNIFFHIILRRMFLHRCLAYGKRMKPVASSNSISATAIRLCIRVHFKLFTSFQKEYIFVNFLLSKNFYPS